MKPRLLDCFSGAGGAGYGYKLAGFHVTGIDVDPQPRYAGDVFIQADALEFIAAHGHEYDAIHASPPCQRYSEATNPAYRDGHPDLIEPSRRLLKATGRPYVIENVEGAIDELINPVILCGTMFGLPIWRHRCFEIWPELFFLLPPCAHVGRPILITGMGNTPRKDKCNKRYKSPIAEKRQAIGIDWMTTGEITQAIPPAYTKWIGERLLSALTLGVVNIEAIE